MNTENNKYKQRFVVTNLNIPTPRVELYANVTKPEAFRRGRRISYPYPTPIFRCVCRTVSEILSVKEWHDL